MTSQIPMSQPKRWFLAVYLLAASVLCIAVVYSLWSGPDEPAQGANALPTCIKDQASIASLSPVEVTPGSGGSNIMIAGCGFDQKATQVKFDGTAHQALVIDSSHVRIGLLETDVSRLGTILITLANDGKDFGYAPLKVAPETLRWDLLKLNLGTISREAQLLLLVLFTGAFGSCIYGLKSLADYLGNGDLYDSWFAYYVIQPFEGAGVAFLLYLAVRAGFLAGSSTDVKTVNQFGVCAIAGLGGAFSDTAFLKLREVFQTLFKPRDDRSGKMTSKITTTELPDGALGQAYNQQLQLTGGTSPLKWTVTPSLPASLTLDPTSGTISGTPTVASAKTSYTFTVIDSATPPITVSVDLPFEIK